MLKNPGKCGMEICMEIAKVRNIRKSVREEWRNNKSMQTEAKSTVVRRQLEKPRVVALQRWFDVSATHRALQAAANYFESLRYSRHACTCMGVHVATVCGKENL